MLFAYSRRMAKTAALALRIEPTLKGALQELAKADKRSLASYVEIILESHVATKMAGKKRR